jgi:aspartyl-tRNA(Asn)/glutamyl-tRNA(Gln) amidotransferase subunit B
VPITLTEKFIEEKRKALPELPRARKLRFVADYGITIADAAVLCAERALADYFEAAAAACQKSTKRVANWIIAEVMRVLNEQAVPIAAFSVPPARIGELVGLIEDATISGKIAKQVFEKMLDSGRSPAEIVKAEGLVQVTDSGAIEAVIDQVLAANPAQVDQYRTGKTTVKGFLVGQIMKASQGKANPQLVNEILERKLGGT